jgi:Beta-lactamase
MSDSTIIHVASMSKPICAAAFVAMLDDWQALKDAFQHLASQPKMTVSYKETETFDWDNPHGATFTKTKTNTRTHQVPACIAPLFSNASYTAELEKVGLASLLPSPYKEMVHEFATGWEAQPTPKVPPGYFGLLRKICQKVPVPQYSDPFLPVIRARVEAWATQLGFNVQELNLDRYATNMNDPPGVTIDDLIRHDSRIQADVNPMLWHLIKGGKDAVIYQPVNGGHATWDAWTEAVLSLSQNPNAPGGYKNEDYTVLGNIIEECTGGYDDYVYDRLFHDSRFHDLRRYVVDPNRQALYYTGNAPQFKGGIPFPDYRGFTAAGGFYFSATQITDWLHALYTRQAVSGVMGAAPLLSQTGQETLFGGKGYFSAGADPSTFGGGWSSFVHNGGTTFGGGSANGELGIFVGQRDDTILTAFMCTNGSINATPPFNTVMKHMLRHAIS